MIHMSSSVHAIRVAGALGFPRYGSSPTPFGGLGSLRDSPLNPADPFGALARPGFPPSTSAGVWPLKSESSLLSLQEKQRREVEDRRVHEEKARQQQQQQQRERDRRERESRTKVE